MFYAIFVCCILSVIQLCYINRINKENQHIISNNIESNSRDNLNNIELIVNPDNTIYIGTVISS
tara:strand:- start:294 stop:485 length:192 start_codon:yes stop_codon:yes gene_type:complete